MVTFGQNKTDLKATFDVATKQIKISQTIQYKNTTQDTLHAIYLNDWPNSFSTKSTPLAKRFTEEYKTNFHFAKSEDRGFTAVTSITQNNDELEFSRVKNHPDVIKVKLPKPLQGSETYTINLQYIVQVPNDNFTRYGWTSNNDFNLRYWYITPAVYNGTWNYYSNKDLDDLFIPVADLNLEIEFPSYYSLISELSVADTKVKDGNTIVTLQGKNSINSKLFLKTKSDFNSTGNESFSIVTNINEENLNEIERIIITDKIITFITDNFGEYPHEKLLLTEIDYRKNPIYGLNQLPNFIRPFPNHFQYELKLIKTALNNYFENILLVNPRDDYWLNDGLQVYYLMKYVDEHYPNMKLFGTLSNIWGIRAFHATQLQFNNQYTFLYMHMARSNLDQPLAMPKDSLLKFNSNIANKYKAGLGLKYLEDYLDDNVVQESIDGFISLNKLKQTSTEDFETLLRCNTTKDVDWFFNDYIQTRKKIDYKIKGYDVVGDSLEVTIKNKRKNNMPISLFGIQNDSIVYKTWINNITETEKVNIPKAGIDKLVLNYDMRVPEFNLRDDWKSLKGFIFNNKPLQFRLFKDIEDPYYNQVFFMPDFTYNYYDGFAPGIRLYNKTALPKEFLYSLRPRYAIKSKQLIGNVSLSYTHQFENKNLYYIKYGFSGEYSNYAPNLSYTSYTPYVNIGFRNSDDFRDNKKQSLTLRYISISREDDPSNIYNKETQPDYDVFNIRYGNTDPNLKNHITGFADFQLAKNFGKIAVNFEYRKLTENNRNYNLRLFAGTFLYNNTYETSDYFSFALDRPTDYLFDYNYLGRSEESGVLSQELVIAEGGFKSKLDPAFANQWMTTLNGGTTIWKYIELYGDLGLVKNHGQSAKFVYDTGFRLNLIADYFELYFPVYSNLGWEISQPQYAEKIRFIVTLSPKTLLGLFKRRWY
ncbi:aminopeptidase N [Formosa agariphila KMM 3901]|uniref:Aminopeptidase N n=1 Tax=Formosa agariphila (strain DSM 15362 / KCTC 12365 / LMG 23005 / KMM 3901 / M-2Alg 35-1) TaxID=1347342 RepID=T2KMI2_FORAG|nr:metalloprotease [Formosa agariphila]CDF79668.1 aminopeptidase N [Formosa agariphila KMM 3901]